MVIKALNMKCSFTLFSPLWLLISFILLDSSYVLEASDGLKEKCTMCKDIVKNFHEGIKNTEKSNFGGGNTRWEEKSLGKYVFSETRLIEITEKLCTDSKSKCHTMVEDNEELIENWWFKHYAKDKKTDLFRYLCVNNIRVCCNDGRFGAECTECPGGADRPCKGHGDCDGSGTRTGTGKCTCHAGYDGDLCDSCVDGYYEESKNETNTVCKECHKSCKDTCHEDGPGGCDECKAGWKDMEGEGCTDINECQAGTSTCTENQFCTNNEGSFECTDCDSSCNGCTAAGNENCVSCKDGYLKEGNACLACHESCQSACTDLTPAGCAECKQGYSWVEGTGCQDVDECAADVSPCQEKQFCSNTEGSYGCDDCDSACKTCTVTGAENCLECNTGYEKKDNLCTDIDECLVPDICSKKNEQCVNSAGGFSCECVGGHTRQDGVCQPKPKGKKKNNKKNKREKSKEDKGQESKQEESKKSISAGDPNADSPPSVAPPADNPEHQEL